jgi:hypothetical protein
MSDIKRRRLSLPVRTYAGDSVGDYVPFYFCPRSIMLFLIRCGNHCDLAYRGGQEPIVHLEADFHEVITWADMNQKKWAFSLSNAGAVYAEFRNRLDQLDEIDWDAVRATDFRSPRIKEGKQAEFLFHEFFPWGLVRRIGVNSTVVHRQVAQAMATAQHKPTVEICRQWYFN